MESEYGFSLTKLKKTRILHIKNCYKNPEISFFLKKSRDADDGIIQLSTGLEMALSDILVP
jgi:hypothetical protein